MPSAINSNAETNRVPLVQAAMRLRITRERLLRQVVVGNVQGGQDRDRRWYVEATEINRLLADQGDVASARAS